MSADVDMDQCISSPVLASIKSEPIYEEVPEALPFCIKSEPDDDASYYWQSSQEESVCIDVNPEDHGVNSGHNSPHECFVIGSPLIEDEPEAQPSYEVPESSLSLQPVPQSSLQLCMANQQLVLENTQPQLPTILLLPAVPCGSEHFILSSPTDFQAPQEDGISFGWVVLQGARIPFIIRHEMKYVPLRAIECTFLNKSQQTLPASIYSTTYIKAFFVTPKEASLLSDVNEKCCGGQFGRKAFTLNDVVIQLDEAEALLQFLTECHDRLSNDGPVPEGARFGLIDIAGIFTPYVKRGKEKYVPLSLCSLDCGTDICYGEKVKVEGWELAYLNFCSVVAGVVHEPALQNWSLLVPAKDVELNMGAVVPFEEWWPATPPCGPENSAGAVVPISFWAQCEGGVFVSDKAGLCKLLPGTPLPSLLQFSKTENAIDVIPAKKLQKLAPKPWMGAEEIRIEQPDESDVDSKRVHRKYCCVPNCPSTSTRNPDKIFVYIPQNPKRRKLWLRAMRRSENTPRNSPLAVCQDHFNIEDDMINYMQFKLMGGRKAIKPDVVPHIFHCQEGRGRKRARKQVLRDSLRTFDV